MSRLVNIYELLEKQDRQDKSNVVHPLRELIPKTKITKFELRKKICHRPKITERFKNTYVNRLIFKYDISL